MTTATSNTHIRIKRSSANSAPDLLQAGELAYSYVSNTAFIGTADGLGVLKIGGEAYTAIIDSANTQNSSNTLVLRDVDGSFAANVVTANYFVGDGSQLTGLVTNLTFTGDTGGPNTLSLLTDTLTLTGGEGITSTIDGNTVTFDVDDTVLRSNTEGSSQHISTDVQISGNLTVQGTTTYVQTSINQTDDSMIELAANNTVGDVLDIGFYGKHEGVDGTVVTGLVRNAGTSDYYLFDNIAIGDQANLTSNLITQGSMSANGASLYAKQFLASQGDGSNGGYSFSGNEGGLDTGMFSPTDGELQFYSNAVKTFSSNGASFNVLTYAQFENTVRVFDGNSLLMNNYDNGDNIYIVNNGSASNSRLLFGDNNLETDILGIESNTGNSATQITLYNSTDVRDAVTQESVIIKGEQKYGVVTQFLVNGTDPVTQKEIIDPLVPPAIRDMTPVDLGNDYDDAFVGLTTPFDIVFNGTTYTSGTGALFVGSNGYLTFGTGSGNNSHDYPPVATNPGVPAIVVGLGDISYQRVYTHDDGNGHFRVRYEGSNFFSGQHIGGSSSLIWEVVFYRDVPGKFDVRIIRMNGTANDGTDGRWNTYLTDGTNFLDTRADRTIPWTTYTQFSKQLTNGTNTLELLDDGSIKMTNGTILSDTDSGLFVDSLASGETSNIVFYNTSTKELTYGTMADLRPDRIANNSYSWEVDGTTGALFSDQGVYIADNSNSVIIGQNVDLNNTNTNRVVIGNNAGNNNQGYGSTAVGENAGQTNQGFLSVAIGVNAGNDTQGHSSVAIGHTAGRTGQGTDAIAIGVAAGLTTQGQFAVAVGERAGYTVQGQYAVSLGSESGYTNQTQYAVAIGYQSGYTSQSEGAVALGQGAGYTTQAYRAVAVGHNAGYNNQGYKAVAIGKSAGEQNQGQDSVAVGHRAGNSSQSLGGVAIGYHAGDTSQGQYSIAIGYRAGLSNQVTNSIVFDAMNSALSPVNAGLYINPIRYVDTQDVDYDGIAFYNASTKEMTYSYVLDGGVF